MTRRRYRTTVAMEYFERSFPVGTICVAATSRQIDRALGRLPKKQSGSPAIAMRWAIHNGEYACVRFPGDGVFTGDYRFRLVPTSQLEEIDD